MKFPEGYLYSHFKWEVSHPKFTLIHNFITNPSNPDCEDLYEWNHLETSGKTLYPSLMLNMMCKISKENFLKR